MRASVDRIENGVAVLIPRDDQVTPLQIPVKYLSGVKEGDIVVITFTKDETSTHEVKERVSSLIEKLRKKDMR